MFIHKLTGRSSGAFLGEGKFIFLLAVNPDGIKYSSFRSELLIENSFL